MLLRAFRIAIAFVLGLASWAAQAAPVVVLKVQDAIGPASADYMLRGMAKAHERGAKLVVIEIDTPGGLDTSMRTIIQAILASPVPIAVYVSPEGSRAASAGTYILYAAHIAAMAPATTLGAATPVAIGLPGNERKPEEKPPAKAASEASAPAALGDAMTAKQIHDAAAFIRGLAQQRGRNAQWAERAVREAVSLTADEALRDKVIDVVARDVPDLLAKIDGKTVHMQSGELKLQTRGLAHEVVLPDWRQRLLSAIGHPSVALILMMIGIYGLIFEFSSPGFGVAGVTGAICLLLALFALQMLPVNYVGLALILLGLGLLAAEVHLSAFGVLGVGGIVAFVAGAILLFDSDVPGFGAPLPLIFGLAASSALVIFMTASMALRARRRPVVSGRDDMVGTRGVVSEVDGAEAWAMVQGERWRVSSSEPLQPGQAIRVLGVHGLTLEARIDHDAASKGHPS